MSEIQQNLHLQLSVIYIHSIIVICKKNEIMILKLLFNSIHIEDNEMIIQVGNNSYIVSKKETLICN